MSIGPSEKEFSASQRPLSQDGSCPGCGFASYYPFFNQPRIPVDVGRLPESREKAEAAQCGEIKLGYCPSCRLITNRSFDETLISFTPGYQVSLLHTPTFRQYIESVVERLVERYGLQRKQIFEIGCGGGEFLRLICRRGGNTGHGVDPTIAERTEEECGAGRVTFLPGTFSSSHSDLFGDFVCCLSVFEDIPDSFAFLRQLREGIGDRNIPVYFEVFNGFRAIESGAVWSIHYEQCNYFSLTALESLFQRAGFELVDSGACYVEGEYLFIEARPGLLPESPALVHDEEIPVAILNFEHAYRSSVAHWEAQLKELGDAGKRVALWGSGGKGVSMLNALEHAGAIGCVVDVNPDRQGFFIPGTGHQIVAPEQLLQAPPDAVIITNPLYEDEIRQQLGSLGINCEVHIA